jgi:hypothetical protein
LVYDWPRLSQKFSPLVSSPLPDPSSIMRVTDEYSPVSPCGAWG